MDVTGPQLYHWVSHTKYQKLMDTFKISTTEIEKNWKNCDSVFHVYSQGVESDVQLLTAEEYMFGQAQQHMHTPIYTHDVSRIPTPFWLLFCEFKVSVSNCVCVCVH